MNNDDKKSEIQRVKAELDIAREALLNARRAHNQANFLYKKAEARVSFLNRELYLLEGEKQQIQTVWPTVRSYGGSAGGASIVSHSTVTANSGSVPGQ